MLLLYYSKPLVRLDTTVIGFLLSSLLHGYLDLYMQTCTASAVLDIANLTTIRFSVRQDERLKMPEHPGSMLRGTFGVALRSLTCITDLPECRLCPLKQHCNFPRIFETPALQTSTVQAVNPYIIHVPTTMQTNRLHHNFTSRNHNSSRQPLTYKKGDIWHFGMTVMGTAIAETDLIIKAWQLALQTGLGAQAPYKRATLIKAVCNDQTLYISSDCSAISTTDMQAKSVQSVPAPTAIETEIDTTERPVQLTLRFVTPFRYQQDNRIVSHPDKLDSTTFIASLYNRIRLCQKNHSPNQHWDIGYDSYHDFKDDIASLAIETDISANHVSRRSNRQQRKMQLYGLQGDIHLTGDSQIISRLLPALRLGEQIHIGKNTTMGLGQYQLLLTPALS